MEIGIYRQTSWAFGYCLGFSRLMSSETGFGSLQYYLVFVMKIFWPDGYTIDFYKAAWAIVGNELIIEVVSFSKKVYLSKGINTTILDLIPKTIGAKEMKDY